MMGEEPRKISLKKKSVSSYVRLRKEEEAFMCSDLDFDDLVCEQKQEVV